MPIHWTVTAVVFLLLSVGLVVWICKRGDSVSAGFAALGACVGLMLGLSGGTLFSVAVAAILAAIMALIPIYFPRPTPPGGLGAGVEQPPALGTWLFPFGGAALLGTLFGLVLQTNHALEFSSANLRDRYRAQGFTDEQISLMMNAHAKAVKGPPPGVPAGPATETPSNLQQLQPLPKKDNPGGVGNMP